MTSKELRKVTYEDIQRHEWFPDLRAYLARATTGDKSAIDFLAQSYLIKAQEMTIEFICAQDDDSFYERAMKYLDISVAWQKLLGEGKAGAFRLVRPDEKASVSAEDKTKELYSRLKAAAERWKQP